MAAITGRQEFINNLTGFLKKANLSGTAEVWYSFYPHANQSNYEFVFNDLLPENQTFLQGVTGVHITNPGTGYGMTETPSVTFVSNDNGVFASGTAVMSVISGSSNLLNQLAKAWPVDLYGSSLINNGDFANLSTGWYGGDNGFAPATNSGLMYRFESGGLHVSNFNHVAVNFTNNSIQFVPNSGTLSIIGGNSGSWVAGSVDVISGDNLTVLTVGGSNIIDITTTGTKYFAFWLTSGVSFGANPFFIIQSGSNVLIDNVKIYTGDIGTEAVNGIPSEFIQRVTADSDGSYFSGLKGKNALGLIKTVYKSGTPIPSPASFDVAANGTMLQTANNTIAFWHYFKNQNSGLPISQDCLLSAWWAGFELHLTNFKYRVKNVAASNTLLTTVQPTDGWHLIAMGLSQQTPSSPITQFISVDNQYFSGSFPSGFSFSNPNPSIRFFGPVDNYDIGVDELYVWNRALSTGEINQLWNSGSGLFYPFATGSTPTGATRFVTDITLTNGGNSYLTAPTIVIAAPSGSGTRAMATALLGPDTGRIYAESFPGLSVGGTNAVVTGMLSGSGIFFSGNNDFLRIGNHLPFDNFTALINFGPSGHVKGTNQVLLASMEYTHQQSGFILSINDANRLVFEYMDKSSTDSVRRHRIHDEELGKNNLVAISKDDTHKVLTVCFHDLADHDTRSKVYHIPGYRDSNTLYLGGFTNSGNKTDYTGFAGRIYDFLLLNGAANAVQCDALSKAFFTTGYTPSGTTGVFSYFPIVTGVVFQTVVTGSGITGYSLGAISIPDKDGTNITVYDTAPLTGNLSGSGVVYLSGTSSGVRITQMAVPEQFYFSNPYIKQYAEEYLVMLNYSVVPTDMIQIYSFSDKQIDKVSVIPQPFNLNDYYLLNSFDPSSVALVFNDGLLQVEGINYAVASGKIISNGLSAFQSTYNFLLYDEISGDIITSGWTGWSGTRQIMGSGAVGWRSNAGTGSAAEPDGSQEIIFDSSFGTFDSGIGGVEAFIWDSTKPARLGDIYIVSGEAGGFAQCQSEIDIDFGILTTTQGFVPLTDGLVNVFGGTGAIVGGFTQRVVVDIPISGYPAFRYFSTYTGDAFSQTVELYKIDSTVTQKRDIYLNGQKLVSGFDYLSTGSGITLTGTQNGQPVVWASGTFAFTSSRTGNRQEFTGSGFGFERAFTGTTLASLMDEMVWLNGQRLAPDFDYKKVSSASLLLSTTRPSNFSFQLYTGDTFPLSILTGRPNI
jgi:hypothetical protein